MATPFSADESASASSWLQVRRPAFDDLVAGVEEYAIFTIAANGTILDWNRGAERIKGFTAEEIIGQPYWGFFSEPEQAAGIPQAALEIAARDGFFIGEGWRLRKNGERFWGHVTLTALRSGNGELEGYLQITRDLTQRRLTMEALRQSEERFRLLVECVQDYAIFMLDPEGHVMSWNGGARRIKGYEQEEILGRHFSVFYPPAARDAGLPGRLLALARTEGRAENEGWRMRKDGSRFWGHVILTALHDHTGELRGFAKVTRDLTDRRQVETLREAGRRKDAFLATLAHELRNPLAPLLPGVEIILRSPGDTARVSQVAAMLHRQVDHMARLIDDLLDVSRITTGKIDLRITRVPLDEIVERSLETVRAQIEAKRQALAIDLPTPPVMVEADVHRLTQVFFNLLSNAAKYTPDGGHLSLTATQEGTDQLRVTVKDDGQGISQDEQQSVFELFDQGARGSSEGLGVGLTMVRSLVEKHRGTVTLASAGEGKGSEFTVLLPIVVAAEAGITGQPDVPVEIVRCHDNLRVLVADDGKSVADIMGMFFQMEGMQAMVAYDGEQAIELAGQLTPDLVILDLGMPHVDGFEACRQIRKICPHAVMVALSGWGSKDDRRRTADAGFDEHLVKPVSPAQLRDFVNHYFPQGKVSTSAAG